MSMLTSILKKAGLGFLIAVVLWFLFGYSPEEEVFDDGKIHIEYWTMTGQKDQVSYTVPLCKCFRMSMVKYVLQGRDPLGSTILPVGPRYPTSAKQAESRLATPSTMKSSRLSR